MALSKITEEHVVRSFEWWDEVSRTGNTVADFGYLLFELFSCRDNLVSRVSSAWPRPEGYKHMLLIGAGCAPNAGKDQNAQAKWFIEERGPKLILGEEVAAKMIPVPNALEDFHDMSKTYGSHYQRLREVKRKYDPNDRLKGWIRPAGV